jgi:hypothetical protein
MSSNTMLKQAIIDANALRESALKNAEAIVVKKYSNQIKEAVDMMLEQEEEEMPMDPMIDPTTGDELPASRVGMTDDAPESELEDQVTFAATDGERLCPCPDEPDTLTIDFKGLQDMIQGMDDAGTVELPAGTEEEEEELAPPPNPAALGEQVQIEEDEEIMLEIDDLLDEDVIGNAPAVETAEAAQHAAELVEMDSEEHTALENDIETALLGEDEDLLEEETAEEEAKLKAAEEKRKKRKEGSVNPKTQKDADDFFNSTNEPRVNESAARAKKNSKALNENKVLKEQQRDILRENKQLTKENKEIKSLLVKVSGKLEEVNLSNAKLIYTNQVLNGTSLNERQKQRIVESINGADSVDAAKSIYETLQSAVGSSLKSREKSQSLSEAVTRGSATTLRQSKQEKRQDPHIQRMKKLAGI